MGCIKSFMACFKQRIIDCRWQDWDYHIQTSERFSSYRLMKTNNLIEPYFSLNINSFVRNALTKFRFGVSDIIIHCQRYKQSSSQTCRMCKQATEDEVHFVFDCPALYDLRKQYIPPKYYSRPSTFRLVLLMSAKNENTVRNFALFLYKAFKRLNLLS
eukprot:TRINITY_DN5549_c0_g1_i5.p2 TRINITY_DN5549_c0_g1~~TRINITY_DN5549_c0_g1_i5.p2  ORF type:complete len:158 (-),score=2.85 TRINITY_DN5549_c0_g1_i5:16-489(-)